MSAAPHFRTDPKVAATFDRLVGRNPASAARQVVEAGFALERGDVATPHLDELEKLSAEVAPEYSERRATELANERRARQIVANQENLRRHRAESAAAHASADRAARIDVRAAEIEAAWWAQQRADWRRIATAEIDGVTSHPIQSEATSPARSKARRVA